MCHVWISQRKFTIMEYKTSGLKWSFDFESRKKYSKDLLRPDIEFLDTDLYFKH